MNFWRVFEQEELMKDGWGNPVGPLPTASQDDDEDAAAKKKKEVSRKALKRFWIRTRTA